MVGQAAVFALAHLTYYPRSAWPLILVVFLVGLITGVLIARRGTLLSAGIVHGFAARNLTRDLHQDSGIRSSLQW
ncbi:CPBP family intramembrane glutamic endopeptidase [Halogranum rubrum]|uniref:CPBP family intramembrane glutamic endopeptidase n=1 Tax=Halogranum rubrum TaxID=553466 RepID=UPI0036F2A18F